MGANGPWRMFLKVCFHQLKLRIFSVAKGVFVYHFQIILHFQIVLGSFYCNPVFLTHTLYVCSKHQLTPASKMACFFNLNGGSRNK